MSEKIKNSVKKKISRFLSSNSSVGLTFIWWLSPRVSLPLLSLPLFRCVSLCAPSPPTTPSSLRETADSIVFHTRTYIYRDDECVTYYRRVFTYYSRTVVVIVVVVVFSGYREQRNSNRRNHDVPRVPSTTAYGLPDRYAILPVCRIRPFGRNTLFSSRPLRVRTFIFGRSRNIRTRAGRRTTDETTVERAQTDVWVTFQSTDDCECLRARIVYPPSLGPVVFTTCSIDRTSGRARAAARDTGPWPTSKQRSDRESRPDFQRTRPGRFRKQTTRVTGKFTYVSVGTRSIHRVWNGVLKLYFYTAVI